MNISNPTSFAAPDLTLSTSNSSGTAGALRADDTLAVFDTTVPVTIVSGASAATGSQGVVARRDHTHGAPAIGDVVGPGSSVDNEIVRYSSTTGKLVQAYTGTGPTVSDTGIPLYPGLPAFVALNSSSDSNVTGAGGIHTFQFDDPIINRGDHFDEDNSRFTAPVAGIYQFNLLWKGSGLTVEGTKIAVRFITTQLTYVVEWNPGASGDLGNTHSILTDMAADDTLTCTLVGTGESGGNIWDISGGAVGEGVLSGFLVG